MATMVTNIPDAMAPDLYDALAQYGGWKPGDGPKAAFAKQVNVNWMKGIYRDYMADKAATDARATAIAQANAAAAIT